MKMKLTGDSYPNSSRWPNKPPSWNQTAPWDELLMKKLSSRWSLCQRLACFFIHEALAKHGFEGCCFFFWSYKLQNTVDGSEIPNNHMGCIRPLLIYCCTSFLHFGDPALFWSCHHFKHPAFSMVNWSTHRPRCRTTWRARSVSSRLRLGHFSFTTKYKSVTCFADILGAKFSKKQKTSCWFVKANSRLWVRIIRQTTLMSVGYLEDHPG